jgi:acetolactate synthase-1/2/3 large subunit
MVARSAARALDGLSRWSRTSTCGGSRSATWQERFPLVYDDAEYGRAIKPQHVVERLRDAGRPPDTIVVGRRGPAPDVGVAVLEVREPLHGSTPAARAPWASPSPPPSGPRWGDRIARCGHRRRRLLPDDGAGARHRSAEQIPVKIAILNNAYLGMVRQWQEMFYEERYSEVYLSPDLPDYVKWAEAMGCVGIRAETIPKTCGPAIEKANSIDDVPVVVDFRTDAFGEGLSRWWPRARATTTSWSTPTFAEVAR